MSSEVGTEPEAAGEVQPEITGHAEAGVGARYKSEHSQDGEEEGNWRLARHAYSSMADRNEESKL